MSLLLSRLCLCLVLIFSVTTEKISLFLLGLNSITLILKLSILNLAKNIPFLKRIVLRWDDNISVCNYMCDINDMSVRPSDTLLLTHLEEELVKCFITVSLETKDRKEIYVNKLFNVLLKGNKRILISEKLSMLRDLREGKDLNLHEVKRVLSLFEGKNEYNLFRVMRFLTLYSSEGVISFCEHPEKERGFYQKKIYWGKNSFFLITESEMSRGAFSLKVDCYKHNIKRASSFSYCNPDEASKSIVSIIAMCLRKHPPFKNLKKIGRNYYGHAVKLNEALSLGGVFSSTPKDSYTYLLGDWDVNLSIVVNLISVSIALTSLIADLDKNETKSLAFLSIYLSLITIALIMQIKKPSIFLKNLMHLSVKIITLGLGCKSFAIYLKEKRSRFAYCGFKDFGLYEVAGNDLFLIKKNSWINYLSDCQIPFEINPYKGQILKRMDFDIGDSTISVETEESPYDIKLILKWSSRGKLIKESKFTSSQNSVLLVLGFLEEIQFSRFQGLITNSGDMFGCFYLHVCDPLKMIEELSYSGFSGSEYIYVKKDSELKTFLASINISLSSIYNETLKSNLHEDIAIKSIMKHHYLFFGGKLYTELIESIMPGTILFYKSEDLKNKGLKNTEFKKYISDVSKIFVALGFKPLYKASILSGSKFLKGILDEIKSKDILQNVNITSNKKFVGITISDSETNVQFNDPGYNGLIYYKMNEEENLPSGKVPLENNKVNLNDISFKGYPLFWRKTYVFLDYVNRLIRMEEIRLEGIREKEEAKQKELDLLYTYLESGKKKLELASTNKERNNFTKSIKKLEISIEKLNKKGEKGSLLKEYEEEEAKRIFDSFLFIYFKLGVKVEKTEGGYSYSLSEDSTLKGQLRNSNIVVSGEPIEEGSVMSLTTLCKNLEVNACKSNYKIISDKNKARTKKGKKKKFFGKGEWTPERGSSSKGKKSQKAYILKDTEHNPIKHLKAIEDSFIKAKKPFIGGKNKFTKKSKTTKKFNSLFFKIIAARVLKKMNKKRKVDFVREEEDRVLLFYCYILDCFTKGDKKAIPEKIEGEFQDLFKKLKEKEEKWKGDQSS